jgi:beta-mannosidase
MACNFGWDWGPTVVTAGIWRPIGIETWRDARLERVRPVVSVAAGTGRVQLHTRLARSADRPVRLEATLTGHGRTVHIEQDWPATSARPRWRSRCPIRSCGGRTGLGAPDRYDVELVLLDPDGTELDRWQRRIGFRSVRLDTSPDQDGSATP